MLNRTEKVLIVGQDDVVERSLVSAFRRTGFSSVLSSSACRLPVLEKNRLQDFFEIERPVYVIMTSVRSGGIGANQAHPGEFFYENIIAQTNVIDLSYRIGVKKLLYLAASCVYPKECQQPMKEEFFLAGPMEPTSEAYSAAKAAGIVMCRAYREQYGFPAIAAVPATVYGPGVGHNIEDAHVMDALIGKFRRAAREGADRLELWGTGKPRREFLYSDDLAEACLYLMDHDESGQLINIGVGLDVEIRELAQIIKNATGFKGEVVWDGSKLDGAIRKLLDSSRIFSLGWKPRISLVEGIQSVCRI